MDKLKYDAVLFDLDGVICDTAKLHFLAWRKLANYLDHDIDEQFNESLKGINRHDSLKLLLEHINVQVSEQQFAELMAMKNNWYVAMLSSLTEADILPNIKDLIVELKSYDIKLAIASASKNAPLILQKLNLDSYFDTIADPNKIANGKPSPDIFLLACSNLQVDPQNCIGIEDAQSGIDALNSAHITAIGIGNYLTNCNIKLASTSELNINYFK